LKALLVVGSAPCALEDLAVARSLYPDHEVMLVNGACTMVEKAEHILAGHTDKAEQFAKAREAKFPFAQPVRVHASFRDAKRGNRRERELRTFFPAVTDWWGADKSSGATSASKAALIGIDMGFSPIVLCGCPMDGSGYSPDEAVVKHDNSCQRVGDPRMQDRATIRRYRDKLATYAQTMFKDRVYSMSGYTRKQLGAPPALAVAGWLE
jgi:hypothetical protein